MEKFFRMRGHDRMVRVLYDETNGVYSEVKLTQQQLAKRCFLTRETANRILRLMERKGLIEQHHGRLLVLPKLINNVEAPQP